MNTDKYYYQIEVSMQPTEDQTTDSSYSWIIWETDKTSKESRHKFDCGQAATFEKAWRQAKARYNMGLGKSLSVINGIQQIYQTVYTLEDDTTVVGTCYESESAARKHAAEVQYVIDQMVRTYSVEARKYIPDNK